MSSVDKELYRNLKNGIQYTNLIPKYENLKKEFDKPSDNSNTYDTLNFMSLWAKKYVSQFSKIAPLLRGKTIAQTVTNIYNFLYWHFQYRLDGSTQYLYSPSAAWHFRQKGFDCKTFSILTSILLQNLNIPHAFRMVKQDGVLDGNWSHVYTIVFEGTNYYTIDATRHENKEVQFIDKYDLKMNHIGLAYPAPNKPCGCNNHKRLGLSRPPIASVSTLTAGGGNYQTIPTNTNPANIIRPTNTVPTFGQWAGNLINNANIGDANVGNLLTNAMPIFGGNQSFGSIASGFGAIASGIAGNMSIVGVPIGGFASGLTNIATGNYIGAALDLFGAIKGLFGNGCIGGSAFGEGEFNANRDLIINQSRKMVLEFNTEMAKGNFLEASYVAQRILAFGQIGWDGTDMKYRSLNWNSCSDNSFHATKRVYDFYHVNRSYVKSLKIYLDTFFNAQNSTQKPSTISASDVDGGGSLRQWTMEHNVTEPFKIYTPKANIIIPEFLLTQLVVDNGTDAAKSSAMTAQSWLQSLVNTQGIKPILDTRAPAPKEEPNNQANGGTKLLDNKDATKTAAFPIMPALLVVSLGIAALKMSKN